MLFDRAVDRRQDRDADSPDLGLLFHRLNNQLGIILAHAELLEAKAADDTSRRRAAHVISSVLEALGTVRDLRSRVRPATVTHVTSTTPAAQPDILAAFGHSQE